MSGSDEERTRRLEVQEARLRLAYAALCLAVLGWYLIPEHKRQMAAARLRRAAAPGMTTLLRQWHRLAVRQAMERELAGGGEDYTLSERIRARLAYWAGMR